MIFLNLVQNILSILSSAMLYPVMILLIVFFIWVIITTGGFVSEYLERKKQARRQGPQEFIESFMLSLPLSLFSNPPTPPFSKGEVVGGISKREVGGISKGGLGEIRNGKSGEVRKEAFSEESILQLGSQEMQEMPFYFREYFKELVDELNKSNSGREIRVEYLLQSKEQKMTRSLDKLRLMIRVGPTLGLMGTIIPMGPALSALSQGDLEKLSSNIIIAFTTTVVGLAIGIAAYFLSTVKNRWIHEDIKNLEYFTECIMENKE